MIRGGLAKRLFFKKDVCMKRLFNNLIFCLIFLGGCLPQPLYASQVYGHLYFAELTMETNAGHYLSLQDNTRSAFLMGALAPDSTWIAHMVTNPKIRARLIEKYGVKIPHSIHPLADQFDDIHQNRPTAVALQLVMKAETEEDRAFALGWLSHYTVDSYIHDLINNQGGFVTDPSKFEDPAMKLHDRLEALEMRHVLQLRGESLRVAAQEVRNAEIPVSFLQTALASVYPQNKFYVNQSKSFFRSLHLGSSLIIDSTRWYGYQSAHSPAEILRMKRLLRTFRPKVGKLLEVLTDLPSLQEYNENLVNGKFISSWKFRAAKILQSSSYLIENGTAYYWWKDRQTSTGSEMADAALSRIEAEMRMINPADDLMRPRQIP